MAKRPEAEKYTAQDTDVELTNAQLYAAKVPCRKYIKDPNDPTGKKNKLDSKGDPEYTLYYVNIVYKDFLDMKMRAIEKTKHAIGQEIAKNPEKFVDGITVDSSGKLPKSAIESAKEFKTAAESAKSDKERAELMKVAQDIIKMLKAQS